MAIKDIDDLARSGIRFVNRQMGSGTRILLDMMLKERGIDCHSIQGYEREESTHAATAILVKEGIADTGLAIYPVSRIFSLDFIPLVEEEYDLLVTKEFSGIHGSISSWGSSPQRNSRQGSMTGRLQHKGERESQIC